MAKQIINYKEIQACDSQLKRVNPDIICDALPNASLWLKQCLGETIYNELLENKCDLNDCYKTLWDCFIKIALSRYIAHTLVLKLSVPVTNKGAVSLSGDYSKQANSAQIKALKLQYLKEAEGFITAALQHVEENPDCFPPIDECEPKVSKGISNFGGFSTQEKPPCGCQNKTECGCKKQCCDEQESKGICGGFNW